MSAPTAVHGGTAPLAALTSVFTPPCPTSWLLTTTRAPSQYPAFPTTGPPSCDPPSWRTNIARGGFHYYSPAICPAGFVVGPNCGIAKVRTDEGFPAIERGETAAYCVPIGLTCTTDLTDFRGGVWGFARAGSTAGALVTVGPAIQIRWVDADLTMLETHPLTPGLKLGQAVPETFSAAVQPPSSTSIDTSTTTSAPDKKLTAQPEKPSSTTLVTETRNNDEDSGVTQIFDTRTSTLGPANTAAGNSNGSGGLGSLDRTTSIVVIVVVTVVAGILLWVAAFLLVRRYKKRVLRKSARSRTPDGGSSLEHGGRRTRPNTATPKSISSPMSELEGPPIIGSTPNPAELEGEVLQPPARSWLHRASRVRHSHLQPPPYTPRSMASTAGSGRRTVRESFGEKVNDPAAALSRLRIPNPLPMSMSMGRPSPTDASPRRSSFWRMPRSPRSPAGGARMSRQLSKTAMGPPGDYMPG